MRGLSLTCSREHLRISKTLCNPPLLIESSQEFIARKRKKNTPEVCQVLFLSSKGLGCYFKYHSYFFPLPTNLSFLVSNMFRLGVGLCYLLLFVSALNTLVAHGSSRTHHGNWCLRLITFFISTFYRFLWAKVQRHVARSESFDISSWAVTYHIGCV